MSKEAADVDQTILSLIGKQVVSNQTALLKMLAKEGMRVTQSTLSRHLKKLSIRKFAGRYVPADTSGLELPDCELIEVPPNLIVVRTPPGFAAMVAVRLDEDSLPGQAGTIAGDDTIFIAIEGGAKVFASAVKAARSLLKA